MTGPFNWQALLLGATASLVAFGAARALPWSVVFCASGETELTCWREWQTLLSGVVAMLAAGATIYFLSRDSRAQQNRHNEQVSLQTAPLHREIERLADDLTQELYGYYSRLNSAVQQAKSWEESEVNVTSLFEQISNMKKQEAYAELRKRVFRSDLLAVDEFVRSSHQYLRLHPRTLRNARFALPKLHDAYLSAVKSLHELSARMRE